MYNLKITFRRLIKDKVFSTINFVGLTIGIVSSLILFLYVSNEKSFDKHFTDHEKIYRVSSKAKDNDVDWARSLGIIHTASRNIPEVEMATCFSHCNAGTIKIGENTLQQNNILAVDNAFVEMFEVKANVGDLSDINKPNTVFISEDFAKKHFENSNPVGQVIKVEELQYQRNVGDYTICGIVKNTHPKTHFKYDLLLSQKGALQERFEQLPKIKQIWAYHYYKLEKGANSGVVAEKINAFYNESNVVQANGPKEYAFNLTPLTDIHLKSDCRFELKESSGVQNTGLFILISFVILLVSLLNYTNLTIARLMKRSKELGFKKSIGANNLQLIGQVIFEVFFFCLAAIAVAFLVVELIRPIINKVFEIDFRIYYSEPIVYLSILAVLSFCVGFATVFVSVFLFKNRSANNMLVGKKSFSENYVLRSLLVGQVAIVIILLSGTFLVNKQIHFVLNKPLGFDKENVVVLHLKDFSKDPAVFLRELEKNSQVASVGFTRQHFGYPTQQISLEFLGIDGGGEMIVANFNYLKTMNIKLLENWISPPAETANGLVVNNHLYQRLMEKYGSMEAVVAYKEAHPIAPDLPSAKIIGVVEDFNYSSAHQSIGDFAFMLSESNNLARFIHVRLAGGSLKLGIEAIRETWQAYYPNAEFNHFFVDEKIAAQYKAEAILSRILSAFSLVGVLISIIGISALSVYMSQQRTKEIGIRKVNGAKVAEILSMLNKDFIKWVAIAFVIACPVAWFAMNKWLENFAYKTTLSWWIFALAGVLALGIALLTVSWQSWRAATRNPVEALRYE